MEIQNPAFKTTKQAKNKPRERAGRNLYPNVQTSPEVQPVTAGKITGITTGKDWSLNALRWSTDRTKVSGEQSRQRPEEMEVGV